MKRHHGLNDYTFNTQHELFRRVAFHEAGHAVAIYLHNKQQQLPPVAFQIAINAHQGSEIKPSYLAKVEGGRLMIYYLIKELLLQPSFQILMNFIGMLL